MRRTIKLFLLLLVVFTSCKNNEVVKVDKIVVGVFNKNGDSPYCITDAIEALKIDRGIQPRVISAADIVSGKAVDVDVFLFPGGSGRSETGSLGEIGQKKIIDLVKKEGKGVVGICAGAYILSETPGYPSLNLSGAEAIDIEHDHRGHGLVKFTVSKDGGKIFPELEGREISFCQYYEGPVLIPAKDSKYKYTELATMTSDVHTVEGAPKGMTSNRPFIVLTEVEKGMTASVVGHPECTPGMRCIIPRLVRIVSKEGLVQYPEVVVRPYIYKKEILFTKERLKEQREAYNKLIGTKEEKLKAMQDIVDMCAWSAKKWIPPMIRDNDEDVRSLAAKLTLELERTDAIEDLKAAIVIEKNEKLKLEIRKILRELQFMCGEH